MYTRKGTQYGKPQGVVRDDQPVTREGQADRPEVAERLVVLRVLPVEGRGLPPPDDGPLRLAPQWPLFLFRPTLHRPRFANHVRQAYNLRRVFTRSGRDAAEGRHDDELFDKSAAWRLRSIETASAEGLAQSRQALRQIWRHGPKLGTRSSVPHPASAGALSPRSYR